MEKIHENKPSSPAIFVANISNSYESMSHETNLVALRTWPCAKAYAPECTMSTSLDAMGVMSEGHWNRLKHRKVEAVQDQQFRVQISVDENSG